MKKRRLGKSDLYVTELGFGCMSIGTEERAARSIIEAALEEGINYFDTADLYNVGENEKLVGKALKEVREKVIIATKVGNRWNQERTGWSWDPSKSYIKEAVKMSLKRLGTDYIDLFQLHGGTIEDPIEETIEAFEELKTEGFIRYYGISSIRPNVIHEYVKKSSIVSVMLQYSILDRRPEEEILPLLHEHGIGVITRGSVAKGLLTNLWQNKISEKNYLDYRSEELRKILPLLKEKLASSRSIAEVALQYNLANPVVVSVLAGASSPEQVRSNAQAVRSPVLTNDEIAAIHEITKAGVYKQHR